MHYNTEICCIFVIFMSVYYWDQICIIITIIIFKFKFNLVKRSKYNRSEIVYFHYLHWVKVFILLLYILQEMYLFLSQNVCICIYLKMLIYCYISICVTSYITIHVSYIYIFFYGQMYRIFL